MVKIRAYVDTELVKKVEQKFPETRGFNSASQLVDWAFRYLLKLEAVYMDNVVLEKKKEA
jgi:hypothetical protein